MGHFTLHTLICLCSYYVCVSATPHKAGNPEIIIPQRVSPSGSFISHRIPQHWIRTATEDTPIHYLLPISGETHHLELTPNRRLVSGAALMETHSEDGVHFSRVRDVQCHFMGRVRGQDGSKVAVTTCNGLAGYIRTRRGHFLIEPHPLPALADDPHPHSVFRRHARSPEGSGPGTSNCETRGSNEKLLRKRSKNENVPNMYTTNVKKDLYLELLLILDKSFLSYHTKMDVEHYIMTTMNMAHSLFAQESLGRPVYLSIVRIIRLEANDNEINLSLTKDPCKTFGVFQNWQHNVNPGNDSHPNHHDLAILITHVDIYAQDDNRDLLGMAHQAGVCDPRYQGIICVDIGLALGFVISHEIGHASGFGHCLMDRPADHPFDFPDELPGMVYDGDWQCRFKFGSSSALCDTAPRCETILCQVPGEGCIDIHQPPVDGTMCGEDKWCYRGECVQKGMRPSSRDGGWGPWSPWSKCTRTCGTGIAYAERRCDSPQPSNGGEFCKGSKKKYMVCEAEPCPSGVRFRDQQCSKFDNWVYPEDGKLHQWKAIMMYIDDPCVLYCVNEEDTVACLADQVIDGTSCMRGMRDVCIAGKCVRIPCDLNMDSGAVEDVCGVCHGDGTTCTLKEGHKYFPAPTKNLEPLRTKDEIFKLIDVPEGSQNIHIEETELTQSRIEVRDKDGNMVYVEGTEPGLFDVPGSRAWVGTIHLGQETLHIPGPVTEPLSIWVCPMHNITFKYSLAVQTDKRQGAFQWDFVDWTPCTSQCGVGTSEAIARCIEQSSGTVDDRYCEGPKPQEKIRECEGMPCLPRWLMGDWGKCTKKGNNNPCKTRMVRCVRPVGGKLSDMIFIDVSLCPKPKPKERESCSLNKDSSELRQKRKVFHRPNRLHSKTSKKIYLPSSRTEIVPRHGRHADEKVLEKEKDVKKFTLERGRTYIDKQNSRQLQLTIKNEGNFDEEDVTVRTLGGKSAVEELEKIQKHHPKNDQI